MIHASPVAISLSFRRAARVANEQRLTALCHRRASDWADAIREGLDPDIARFIRDQAAAWLLLAKTFAHSAQHAETSRDGTPHGLDH
jgi:hypothetical protein